MGHICHILTLMAHEKFLKITYKIWNSIAYSSKWPRNNRKLTKNWVSNIILKTCLYFNSLQYLSFPTLWCDAIHTVSYSLLGIENQIARKSLIPSGNAMILIAWALCSDELSWVWSIPRLLVQLDLDIARPTCLSQLLSDSICYRHSLLCRKEC